MLDQPPKWLCGLVERDDILSGELSCFESSSADVLAAAFERWERTYPGNDFVSDS
jgi:hypothetical protein